MAIFRCSEWSFFNIYITYFCPVATCGDVATTCPPLKLGGIEIQAKQGEKTGEENHHKGKTGDQANATE